MDYQSKYQQLTQGATAITSDVSNEYPDCNAFEKLIISLRKSNWSYGQIQKVLGMPPKKAIREVLLKWAPELIDNSKSKVIKVTSPYAEIYNILSHTDKTIWNIFGEDVECCIKDKKVYYDGDLLDWYTEVEHNQILNELKKNE